MNNIDELAKIFERFPGIGPRQAKRFVYYLLSRDSRDLIKLSSLITEIKKHIKRCESCFRLYHNTNSSGELCKVCADKSRENNVLMVVCRESDLDAIEKSGAYNGKYFVLGGTVPILHKDPTEAVRSNDLIKRIDGDVNIEEIIISTNANPEGENTAEYIRSILANFAKEKSRNVQVSVLGRGLSTGSELEYADSDTLKSALKNRS